MSGWSIEVREATQADVDRTERPDQASVHDGAAALEVNGELVAVTNEYGTALLVAGTEATPTRGEVEVLVEAVLASPLVRAPGAWE